jgi:origin recognition complex subunit 1
MEVRHPCETYAKFWEALTGHKHIGSHQAAGEKLKRYFTSSKSGTKQEKSVTVLLLDEIDYLITENQTVLYDFFDWPKLASETTNGKRLVVLGISNTLNLIERLLPSVQSRLGKDECTFASYELKDTIAILKNKINEASPVSQPFDFLTS